MGYAMNREVLFWMLSAALLLLGGLKLLDHLLMRNNSTSNVLNAVFAYFIFRKERVMEFRAVKAKVQKNVREFEVKTFHHRYYAVIIKGREVLSVKQLEAFSITEGECFIQGKVDPVGLNNYFLRVNE